MQRSENTDHVTPWLMSSNYTLDGIMTSILNSSGPTRSPIEWRLYWHCYISALVVLALELCTFQIETRESVADHTRSSFVLALRSAGRVVLARGSYPGHHRFLSFCYPFILHPPLSLIEGVMARGSMGQYDLCHPVGLFHGHPDDDSLVSGDLNESPNYIFSQNDMTYDMGLTSNTVASAYSYPSPFEEILPEPAYPSDWHPLQSEPESSSSMTQHSCNQGLPTARLDVPTQGKSRNDPWIHTRPTYNTHSQSIHHSPVAERVFYDELIMFEMGPPQQNITQRITSSQVSINPPAHNARDVKPGPSMDVKSSLSPESSGSLETSPCHPPNLGDPKPGDGSAKDNENCRDPVSSYEFVTEDPTMPLTRIERRPRTKEELQQQKEGIRRLRKFGGACLWCYRSKKRCGPASPCPPCQTNHRECVRNSDQLRLIGPIVVLICRDPSFMIAGPPSPAELSRLCRLGDKPFQRMARFHALINFRPHGNTTRGNNPLLNAWIMEVTQEDAVLSRKTRSAVDQFTSKATKYVQCPKLEKLKDIYGDHPLAQTALKMATLFLNMGSTLQAPIYVHPCDMDSGRLTVFLILAVCGQDLAEISDNFAIDLCDALRRKDKGLKNRFSSKKFRQSPSHPVDPVWIATALYYRVVCGLCDLYCTSPAIRTIWGPHEASISSLRHSLWCMLRSTYSSKGAMRDILDGQIPELSPSYTFDLSFCVGPIGPSDLFPSHGMFRRLEDPFGEPCWGMESFLGDEMVQIPDTAIASTKSIPVRSAVQQSGSSAVPDMVENILDPLHSPPWELMVPMDAVYTDNLGCNFDV
ncbi:hypothetical protein N7492_009424 [Penicillium capsulatum]|uniref:Zn(2)-C6 fungal-type domain-containing protein n=1 Tax=Penicillium capsulatum TaxID=69766 RepID=A0A9W9HVA7_9EURO|nr:hypothetical protein N7492_009424 [Penicillium capsulatum]KAJ6106816.1 hypothetical protein N7512_010333 [Penicillium capsulatum]